jgi:hypothetical protein
VALADLLHPLLSFLEPLLGPLRKAFALITHLWRNVTDGITKGTALAQLIISEIAAWRNFKQDISYRTGVISVPKAIEQTKEFIAGLIDAWHSIVDLFSKLKGKITESGGGNPTEEAEQAVADIENSGFKGILKQFPKLAKGLEKALGFVALLADALDTILGAIDDLTAIVNALKSIREEVEHGKTVFLQQKNPRKIVQLRKGGSIKIRVGNLHS